MIRKNRTGSQKTIHLHDNETWKFCGFFNHHYDWAAKDWRKFIGEKPSDEDSVFHKCFCCEKTFTDNDIIYAGMAFVEEGNGYQLKSFCKKCAYKISDKVTDYDLVNGEVEITTWEKETKRTG